MKWLTRLLLVVLILLLIVGVGAYVYIDSLAEKGIERGATYATGLETSLDSAHVGVFAGRLELAGLHMDNAPGFDADRFLALDDGRVDVTLGSLRRDEVEIPDLTLTGLDLTLERKDGKDNYQYVLDNLKKLSSEEEPPTDPEEPAKRYVIRQLNLRDVTVQLRGYPLTNPTVQIDQITLENVGSDSDKGVLLSELTGIILDQVFQAVLESGIDLPGELASGLRSGVDALSGQFDELVGQVDLGRVTGELDKVTGEAGKAVEQATEGARKNLEDATKGLGDLLGGDKEEEETPNNP